MNEFERLDEVTQRLRNDCPWDREQTHSSLSRHAIEEVYELLEAIDEWSPDNVESEDHLIEELGDVLVQVFVHSAIANEQGRFNTEEVAKRVADKLIERHPHVYGDVDAATSGEVMRNWEANKKQAKNRASVMDGIPASLPALLAASKMVRKARHAGITVDMGEPKTVGDELFALVQRATDAKLEPELELRASVARFRKLFEAQEQQ